ncbi:Polar amino acid transport system substrate-binding protein [Pseudomonas sp. 8AS]|uniref:hypothetical protein n=1 Tax=Pseudomonas sp. 8AS TaxID=2653163 RepID=UPI0012F2C4F5|nr:hypothetical protein [Pseudomonas sp. 8AS]VXC12478.1 Polar amino acid transport system substrate-binding protein [Pseudomonas sp. 8AS]
MLNLSMPLAELHQAGRLPGRLGLPWLAGLLLCLGGSALAADFSVCVSDEEFPPFTHPRHESQSQQLIRRAAERQGLRVTFVAQPWRRCLAGVRRDLYSAVAGAAATTEYRQFMAFPLLAGEPDPRRALGTTRIVVFRTRGSHADWNGRRFRGLDKPLLYLSGRTTLKVLLEGMAVPTVDTARNSRQLALMLQKERGSLAIDHEHQVERLLAMPEFRGRLEVLPAPLAEGAIYLAVGRQVYESHSQTVEAIWNDIAAALPMNGPPSPGVHRPR